MTIASTPRRLLRWALGLSCAVLAAGCGTTWRVDRMPAVATGFTSHLLCDDVFVTGVDPERAFTERVRPLRGMGLVAWGMRRQVDRERREVRVSIGGAFASRARHLPGLGCVALPDDDAPARDLAPGGPPVEAGAADPAPDRWGRATVVADNQRLRAALERALVDTSDGHRTKAVVVLQGGRLVGERYAAGYGIDTPVLGFSLTKTFTNALVGILVRQGRLAVDQPAPIAAWADAADPRHAITVEQLLRQTSGLNLPQDNSGADISSAILYTGRDKAALAAAAPLASAPGTRWAYADTNFILLSRIVRDAVGGGATDVSGFVQQELFAPLGIRHAVLDFDVTGTAIGSSHLLASARDFARLGQLFLDDGIAPDGRRILPPGWVHMATTPTLDTGYGAGLWTNRKSGLVPKWGVPWGLAHAPADAFFARGFMGQFIVVVPSQQLVLVRLAVSHHRGDDIDETGRIVGEVLDALDPQSP